MPTSAAEAPRRIAVIGCSGSGKSTLAARIAAQRGLPYIATDPVFWAPGWTPTPSSEVTAWLRAAAAAEAWVMDGNFEDRRDILWDRAELIVWIDLPLGVTLWRGARRNLGWWLTGAKVWGGLPMTLRKALGGLRHTLASHGLKRRAYPAFLAAYPPGKVVRLASARAVAAWLTEPAGRASR